MMETVQEQMASVQFILLECMLVQCLLPSPRHDAYINNSDVGSCVVFCQDEEPASIENAGTLIDREDAEQVQLNLLNAAPVCSCFQCVV